MLRFNLAVEVAVENEQCGQDTFSVESELTVIKDNGNWKVLSYNTRALEAWAAFGLDPDMWGCYSKLVRIVSNEDLSECETEEDIVKYFSDYENFETVYDYSFDVSMWQLGGSVAP